MLFGGDMLPTNISRDQRELDVFLARHHALILREY
jgi:hypothetical protein